MYWINMVLRIVWKFGGGILLKNRERMKRLIACGIAASIVSVNGLSVLASELNKSDKVNLALNKKTVASSREVNDK